MNGSISISLLVIMSYIFCGCSARAAFVYTPSDIIDIDPKYAPLPLKVAITHLLDARGKDNSNYVPIALIPGVPFATRHYDRPDAANAFLSHAGYNFRPSEDFARAIADEMKQNKFFEEVFLSQREREPGVDLIVTGKITNTLYNGSVITYCLTFYAPVMWLIGLPAGTFHNTIAVTLEMNRVSDNTKAWSCEINGDWGKTFGLYYNWAADFDGYPMILKQGLHGCMDKLANDIRTKDQEYWKASR